jgi:hypothetical protein
MALVALLVAPTAADAVETRTVGLTAQVISTFAFNAPVCGGVVVGDTITGSYTYTLGTPATSRSKFGASYEWSEPPNGMTLNVGFAVVQTDYNPQPQPGGPPPPPGPLFAIGVADNDRQFDGAPPMDLYDVHSKASTGCFGFTPISLRLEDDTGTALTNTSLPTKAPTLADWNADRPCVTGLGLHGDNAFGSWQICAAVTSLTTIK